MKPNVSTNANSTIGSTEKNCHSSTVLFLCASAKPRLKNATGKAYVFSFNLSHPRPIQTDLPLPPL
jgi:hypothetical protein